MKSSPRPFPPILIGLCGIVIGLCFVVLGYAFVVDMSPRDLFERDMANNGAMIERMGQTAPVEGQAMMAASGTLRVMAPTKPARK